MPTGRLAALHARALRDLRVLRAAENLTARLSDRDASVVRRSVLAASRDGLGLDLDALAVRTRPDRPDAYDDALELVERLDGSDAAVFQQAVWIASRSGHGLGLEELIRLEVLTVDRVRRAAGH